MYNYCQFSNLTIHKVFLETEMFKKIRIAI